MVYIISVLLCVGQEMLLGKCWMSCHKTERQFCLQMREIDKGKGAKRKGSRGDNEGDDVGDRIKFKKKY